MNTSGHQLCIGAHTLGYDVVLDQEERRRHLYIVGQTGTGKSTLLLNLIAQDLAAGEGFALLDPHGDLAESVLAHVPRARTNDLVYINPADVERPIVSIERSHSLVSLNEPTDAMRAVIAAIVHIVFEDDP